MAIVLVTGASRGIGAETSRTLARAGHTVYAGMRKPTPFEEPDGTRSSVRTVPLDVTAPSEVREAVTRILEEEGRIDALVNNAGVAWFVPAEEMSDAVLRSTFETNFFGAVRCTRAVLPVMREQGAGRIVMMSTLAAATGLPLESAYCASKSALEAFAESVRHEVAPFGIDLAVVEPGITEGGLSTSIPDPGAPRASAYRPLLDHTFAYYEAAQAELEPASLVAETVEGIVSGRVGGFRHRLGRLGPVIDEIARAEEPQATAMVREALGIEGWCTGEGAFAKAGAGE